MCPRFGSIKQTSSFTRHSTAPLSHSHPSIFLRRQTPALYSVWTVLLSFLRFFFFNIINSHIAYYVIRLHVVVGASLKTFLQLFRLIWSSVFVRSKVCSSWPQHANSTIHVRKCVWWWVETFSHFARPIASDMHLNATTHYGHRVPLQFKCENFLACNWLID